MHGSQPAEFLFLCLEHLHCKADVMWKFSYDKECKVIHLSK